MAYAVTHVGAHGVRFKRTASWLIVPVAGTFLGSVFLLVGLGLLRSPGAPAFAVAYVVVGICLALAPWYLVRAATRLKPQELVFDNTGACFYAVSRWNDAMAYGAVPFALIESFDYQARTVRGNLSGATGSLSFTAYDVLFIRTDGSTFVLVDSFRNESRAQACVAMLQQYVRLRDPASLVPLGELPSGMSCDRRRDWTEFRWQTQVDGGRAGAPSLSLFRWARSTAFVRIESHAVTCGVQRANGTTHAGATNATLPLTDVLGAGVQYAGDANLLANAHQLRILTHEYVQRARALREQVMEVGSWREVVRRTWDVVTLAPRLPRLETGVRPLVDLIRLENHINAEIAQRKGVDSPFVAGPANTNTWWAGPSSLVAHGPHHPPQRAPLPARLATNAAVGLTACMGAVLPVLAAGLLFLSIRGAFLAQARFAMTLMIAFQFVGAALASWKLLRLGRRLYGAVLGAVTVLAGYMAVAAMSHSLLFVRVLVLSGFLAVAGWTLLSTPEPDVNG